MDDKTSGACLTAPGSCPTDHAPAGHGASCFDPSRYKLKRYDSIATQIVEDGARVIALIEQLANGRWVITRSDIWLTKRTFATVKMAFAYWNDHERDRDAGLAENAKRSNPEGAAARAEGIAHPSPEQSS